MVTYERNVYNCICQCKKRQAFSGAGKGHISFFNDTLSQAANPFNPIDSGLRLFKDIINAEENGYMPKVDGKRGYIEVFINDINFFPKYDQNELDMFVDLIGKWLMYLELNWVCIDTTMMEYRFILTDPYIARIE